MSRLFLFFAVLAIPCLAFAEKPQPINGHYKLTTKVIDAPKKLMGVQGHYDLIVTCGNKNCIISLSKTGYGDYKYPSSKAISGATLIGPQKIRRLKGDVIEIDFSIKLSSKSGTSTTMRFSTVTIRDSYERIEGAWSTEEPQNGLHGYFIAVRVPNPPPKLSGKEKMKCSLCCEAMMMCVVPWDGCNAMEYCQDICKERGDPVEMCEY